VPSKNGLQFVNRFPGFPLPDVLETLIDTSKSVHGLCGGMCFTVIDYTIAKKKLPQNKDVPKEDSALYHYIQKRQFDTWGKARLKVLRFVEWMGYSDRRSAVETFASVKQLRRKLAHGSLSVLGLIYHNFQETLAVWDNHQVLAYGYSELANGYTRIHLYDPNFPKNDNIYLECKPIQVEFEGQTQLGMQVKQYEGDKLLLNVHGFFVVPYKAKVPPNNLK
jgi:hypothetical protein